MRFLRFIKGGKSMEYLVTGSEMKQCDQNTMEHFLVPSCVLMERAALAAVQTLSECAFDLRKVLVVCGAGNNGGDGLAVARLLFLRGIDIDIYFVGKETSCTQETKRQLEICRKYGISLVSTPDFSEYNSIVDALFGIGLSRTVEGVYEKVIQEINRAGARVLALDIPSGIHADTGQVMGTAVSADVTVTFAFCKRGLLLYQGKLHAGKVIVKEIGITRESFLGKEPKAFTYLHDTGLRNLLPVRSVYSNKGTFGKVLMVAGSTHMAGAALLASKAAYKAGAGLVRVFTDSCNREVLQTGLPEAIADTYEEGEASLRFSGIETWASVIGMGPGMGEGAEKQELLRIVLDKAQVPVVLDADALNILARHPQLLANHRQPVVVTPHVGEMARLAGQTAKEVLGDLCQAAKSLAKKYGVVCVLKDAGTVVTDGEQIYINQSGTNGMSTGGSGDVLTGMITGLIAQGMHVMQAACLGVWLHGLAGEEAARQKGVYSMLAGDIIDALDTVMRPETRKKS